MKFTDQYQEHLMNWKNKFGIIFSVVPLEFLRASVEPASFGLQKCVWNVMACVELWCCMTVYELQVVQDLYQ